MSKQTSLEERLQIGALAKTGLSDQQIARVLGWSVHTVRKWRRRQARQGRAGLVSPMGRPKRGALSTFPEALRVRLRGWREAHPGWGAKTLYAELKAEPGPARAPLPSQASIGRFLHEQGLSQVYARHQALPALTRQSVQQPHDVWQLDARGYERVPEVGVMTLVNLNDCFSHARLLSYPVLLGRQRCTRHPNTEDYQTALRLAFSEWGLPRQLQLDHESVFVDNLHRSPYPTRLYLWLLGLGVTIHFIHPLRPTEQGMTERSHRLWAAQCLVGQRYLSWDALYHTLRQRRTFLNYHLDCASLDNRPPLLAFPAASHSGRAYRPEWERDLLDLARVRAYLAQGRWFRKASLSGTFSLGGHVYYLGRAWRQTQLDITFDLDAGCFQCRNEAGDLIAACPVKGLTVDDLMGTLASRFNLPAFQLALPFAWSEFQAVRLPELSAGTTL